MPWRRRIAFDAEVMAGAPHLIGAGMGVDAVLDLLAQGWDKADILHSYPTLQPEDIRACLMFASALVRGEVDSDLLLAA